MVPDRVRTYVCLRFTPHHRVIQAYPLSDSQALLAPQLANDTLKRVAAAVGSDAAAQLMASYYPQLSYCSVQLPQTCTTGLQQ